MAESKLNLKQKREWAELLFARTQMTQKEIAEKVGVTEKTMGDWKNKHNWEQLRTSYFLTKGQELQRIYGQISALNDMISERDHGHQFATAKEADTISKLAAAARQLETDVSISDVVDVFIGFIDWLRENDFNQAKDVSELMDNYIKYKTTRR